MKKWTAVYYNLLRRHIWQFFMGTFGNVCTDLTTDD